MKKLLLICLVIALPFAGRCQSELNVTVHPGVELLTVIQILAGQYPQPNLSAYSKECLEYFGKYKEHPAVKKAASLVKVYSDLPELGWCMSDFPDIKIYEPKDVVWYKFDGRENILEYLKLCRDFFNDTHFWDFYQHHKARYDKWGADLRNTVDTGKFIEKLKDFYKYTTDVHWDICIDPLNSWGSHAIVTKDLNPQFADRVVYTTGYLKSNGSADKDPVFNLRGFEYLVWHEGSHVYINGLLKQYERQIDSLSYLFNKSDPGMVQNNISNWAYCFDENMVRSITAALYKKYGGDRAYRRHMGGEIAGDFIYVEDLAPFIYDNYISTNKYKDFAAFFPEILKYLETKYPKKT